MAVTNVYTVPQHHREPANRGAIIAAARQSYYAVNPQETRLASEESAVNGALVGAALPRLTSDETLSLGIRTEIQR